ncbi:MAG: restriction endonuclease subunit S [Christensenellaceae bacterium]|nr:restriction endonuclease subunit S [Christensenellaceae bacterium]
MPQDLADEPATELLARVTTSHKSHYQIADEPFAIFPTWKWYALGNLVSVIGGVSYDKCDVTKNGIRILRGGNIQNGALLLESDDVFLPTKYKDGENSIKKGDILIVGSTGSETLIGKAGFALKDFEDTQIGAFLRIIRPRSADFIEYLHLIFKSDYYSNYIRGKAKGTTINNIKIKDLTEFAVPIPPLNEQRRIVKTASEILTITSNLQKQLTM